MITLPQKIEEELSRVLTKNAQNWAKSAATLSLKYRAKRVKRGINYIKDLDDAFGYLALKVTSTYSHIYGALRNIRELNPSWNPVSVLDIGSGPGTAIWAALELFPSLKIGTAIERNKNFIELGKTILKSLPRIKVDWQAIDLINSIPELSESFDLVVIANVLNEMDEKTRNTSLEFANKHCKGILVVIEPGTPYGFESLVQTSKQLNSENILIAPYIENSFINSEKINFVEKIKRPEFQKRVRQIQRKNDTPDKSRVLPPSDWEESKYYYLAYSKFKPEFSPVGRLIDKPKLSKPFVELKVLTKEGIKIERIFKKDKARYKLAKKFKWGNTIPSFL